MIGEGGKTYRRPRPQFELERLHRPALVEALNESPNRFRRGMDFVPAFKEGFVVVSKVVVFRPSVLTNPAPVSSLMAKLTGHQP